MLAFLRATGPFLLNFVCKLLGHMAKMATTSIHAIFEVRSGAVVRNSDQRIPGSNPARCAFRSVLEQFLV